MQSASDYRRKWYVMAAVGSGTLLATIDGSIVNVALPSLERAFDTQFAAVQWVVLAYLLVLAALLLTVGRLGDMIGKKPLYVAGFIVFTLSSLLCGLAPGVHWLIASRVVQGIGASALAALGIAILTEAFPPWERGKALGVGGTIVSLGIVIGPTLGGYLIDVLSWRWIFLVNLPIGLVGALMVMRYVPSSPPSGQQSFDLGGAAVVFAGLTALLLGLTLGQRAGFGHPTILLLFGIWVACLGVFLALEARVRQPMINLRLFANPLFTVNLVTGFATFVAIAGVTILMPFYLENILGYPPRQVGLLLAVVPVAMGVIAPLAGSFSDRRGARPITVVGLATLVAGYSLVSTLGSATSVWGYVVRFLPIGIGMGIFQSPNNSIIMGSVPPAQLGVAGGLLAMTRTLGQTTGVALLGTIWAARVNLHAGGRLAGQATQAPPVAQIAGLHDTVWVIVTLLSLALILSAWGLARAARTQEARADHRPQPLTTNH